MEVRYPATAPKTVVTAEEINVLVHGYLADSFPNTASLFRNEARLDSSSLFTSTLPSAATSPIVVSPSSAAQSNAEAGPSSYKRTFTNGRTPTSIQIHRTAAALAKGKGRADEDFEGDEGDPSYKIKSGAVPATPSTAQETPASSRTTRNHARQGAAGGLNGFKNGYGGLMDDTDEAEDERANLAGQMMQLGRARKRELVKFLQLGLMWQESTIHGPLAKQGLQCATPFNLAGVHTCDFQPLPSILDCLTSFQTDLLREPSPGLLSPPKTAADKAMERSRGRKREGADNAEMHPETGKKGSRRVKDSHGMDLDGDNGTSLQDRGQDASQSRAPIKGKDKSVVSSASRAPADPSTSKSKIRLDEQDVPGTVTSSARKHKKPLGFSEGVRAGAVGRVDREDSVTTNGTGRSGKSGGSTTKGGYRVPRILSPSNDEDDDEDVERMSVDEDHTVPAKKRKTSTGRGRPEDLEVQGGGQHPKSRVTSGSSQATNGNNNRKGRSRPSEGDSRRKSSPAASASKASSGNGKASGNDDESSVAAEVVENPLKSIKKADGVTHWRVRWHQKGIAWVAWNPVNQNTLVTGGIDASCSIWEFGKPEGQMDVDDADDLQQLVGLPLNCKMSAVARNKGTTQVLWDSQGTIVVSGCADGNVRAWDVGGAFYGIHARHNGEITAVSINRSGTRVITAGEDKILSIWNIHSATSRDIDSRHTACITDIAFLDDDIFATCAEDLAIVFHSAGKPGLMPSLSGHTSMVNMLRFSPVNTDGSSVGPAGTRRLLASCSDDKSIRIWDVEALKTGGTGSENTKIKSEAGVDSTPVGKSQVAKSAPSLLRCIKGHTDCVALVEWCPVAQADGRRLLATASWANNLSKTDSDNRNAIQVFDVLTGNSLYTLTAHTSKIHKLQFEPTRGRAFASCSDDGTMIIWETGTGKQLRAYETDCAINDLHWRSDGQQLAMAADDGTLRTMFVGDLLAA